MKARRVSPIDFAAVFEAVPHPYLLLDGALTILHANNVFLNTFSLSLSDLIGRPLAEVFPAAAHPRNLDARTALLASLRRAADTGEPDKLALVRVMTPAADGGLAEHLWTVTHTPIRDSGGAVSLLVQSATDVTERKTMEADRDRFADMLEKRVHARTQALSDANSRLQAEIAQREQAEKALLQAQRMEAVGQLTGGVAHDFNNLLTIILGNLELLRPLLNDERLRRRAERAMHAARRGGQLTQQLLAYARKQNLSREPVDANAVIGAMGALLSRTLGGLVKVEADLAADLWHAWADPAQVELMILNLAINARDAMPGGGVLRVATANAAPSALPDELEPGDYVLIAVADTGTGMAPEVLEKATEPFFTTKEPGKGSGLGLSQVYGVTKQFGGAVRLRSRLGKGTTVELFLPRANASAMATGGIADEAPYSEDHAVVLVVDDEADVRSVAGQLLGNAGHQVLEADTGPAAVALAGKRKPDVALVDYAMPGLSGVELARQLRETLPGLPIAYVTGYADPLGCPPIPAGELVLNKPFTGNELLRTVAKLLENNRHATGHGRPAR